MYNCFQKMHTFNGGAMQEYIKIRDKNIPIVVRNYKTSKHLKMYFKADVLYISKPRYVSMKKALEFIKQNEKFVYEKYTDLSENKNFKTKSWINGDVFSYLGEKYVVKADICNENKININLDQSNKMIKLSYPISIAENEEKRKYYIDRGIKQILKNNTRYILQSKVPYWSKITSIPYKEFKVNDATSKFGSCIPSKKVLHFSSRLIMLPEDKIDAIVVHELCHIIHPNHSKKFYNLVKEYIPNYDEINKWLKENGKIIIF